MRSIKLFFIFPSSKIKNKLIHTGGALPFCSPFTPSATILGRFGCFFLSTPGDDPADLFYYCRLVLRKMLAPPSAWGGTRQQRQYPLQDDGG